MSDKQSDAERLAFEAVYPMPSYGCQWIGNGYCATQYNAWDAQKQIARYEGWKAARALLSAAPDAPQPAIQAVMQQALDALKVSSAQGWDEGQLIQSAIKNLKSALAQAVQLAEPLTVEQIVEIARNFNTGRAQGEYDFASAIEAARNIKPKEAQP